MSPLATGSTLCDGRYRLEEVVGRGGMAAVWRATDLQLERTVAIKVISDVLAGDASFLARFEREARLAAGLNHPNLVKVFDYSLEGERPFLVMEYVPGGTLAQRREDLDPLELARALLDALAHIHAAGILHRDVKPANVLLDAAGSPRLTDFGIARGDDTAGLTMTGQVLGTLRYIAPEVAAGEPATVRSDLYSLGVLLSEIAGDGAPPDLADLIARLTARDPAERPASATEALAELAPTRPLAEPDPTLPLGESDPTRPLGEPDPTRPLSSSDPSHARPPMPTAHIRIRIGRGQLIAAAAVLAALFAIVAVAALSGGGSGADGGAPGLEPAPAGAPVDRQIDRLEQIIRAAPRER